MSVPTCPECKSQHFQHDKLEDMYRCQKCEHFWTPEEIGAREDPNAGYRTLNGSSRHEAGE